MPKVKNESLMGARVGVLDAAVEFDAEGCAEVTAEQAEHLEQIPGFVVLHDAAEAPAPTPKKAPAKKSVPADKE